MHCAQCGAEMRPLDKFCRKCGEKQIEATPTMPVSTESPALSQPEVDPVIRETPPSRSNAALIKSAALVLVLILGGVGYYWYNMSQRQVAIVSEGATTTTGEAVTTTDSAAPSQPATPPDQAASDAVPDAAAFDSSEPSSVEANEAGALPPTPVESSTSAPTASGLALRSPPDSMIGIGREPCFEYMRIYDEFQKVVRGEESDWQQVVGSVGSYANFEGTFGGFLARIQMEKGLQQPPFQSKEEAMETIYTECETYPNVRFIDVVDAYLLGAMS